MFCRQKVKRVNLINDLSYADISRQVMLTPPVCSLCAASFWIIKLRLVRQRPLVPPRVTSLVSIFISLSILISILGQGLKGTRCESKGQKLISNFDICFFFKIHCIQLPSAIHNPEQQPLLEIVPHVKNNLLTLDTCKSRKKNR